MQSPHKTDDNKSELKSATATLQSGAPSAAETIAPPGDRATSAIKSGSQQFSKQAASVLNSAADAGRSAIDSSTQTANQLSAALADNVKSNPVATLAAAVGVGFMLGVLTTR